MQCVEASNLTSKYLTFSLGREGFGIQIQQVREIIKYIEVAAVPRASHYVKGIVNLRGQVISVVDLRSKFRMPEHPLTDENCIVVVDVQAEGRTIPVGVVIDKVSEVLQIDEANIEDPPAFGELAESDFTLGMGKTGKSVKILPDIDRVIGPPHVAL